MRRMRDIALSVDAAALAARDLKGEALAMELRRQRIAAIRSAHAEVDDLAQGSDS